MKGALVNAALVLASVVVGVLVAELSLRAIAFDYPPFYRPDPITGLSLRSNTSGWFRKEGHAYVAINSQGLRDRERPMAKPPGTYRIVVLGDSYAEAMQVDVEKTFWRLLEGRLQECSFRPGKKIDVVNLGVSGFGTGQELRMLESRGLAYMPEMVILFFFPGKDVRNNSRELETDKIRPFYFIDAGGELRRDDTFAKSIEFQRRSSWTRQAGKDLSKSLRSLQLIYYVKDALQAPDALQAQHSPQSPPTGEVGLDDQVFLAPKDDKWQSAWRLTERIILELKHTATAAGSDFLLVTVFVGIQVHPDRAVRDAFARQLGVDDLLYPERRLRQFGQPADIRVMTLGSELQHFADEKRGYLHGFANTAMGRGHWNETGHSAAAELVGAKLCKDK